jgi:hypothetical protein
MGDDDMRLIEAAALARVAARTAMIAAAVVAAPVLAGSLPSDGQAAAKAAPAGPGAASLDCDPGGYGSTRFVVPRSAGGMREMEICNVADHAERGDTAAALSAGMDAAADPALDASDPRTPALVALRLERAHTGVDPSIQSEERARRLAAIEAALQALEESISRSLRIR